MIIWFHLTISSIRQDKYVRIVSPLVKMGYLRDLAPVPIIKNPHKDVDSFEAFAYNFYESSSFYKTAHNGSSDSSNNTVYRGGIYSISPESGEKYHDVSGYATFSNRSILTPILQVYDPSSISAVLYNLHSEYIRGKAIDLVMDAWEANRRTASAVTPMIHLIQDTSSRPASMLFYPIAPASNDSELVGFISAVHNWDTVLEEVVPAHSKGIQIVVSDGLRSATFLAASDSTRFLGWGDLHDRHFDQYRRTFSPADPSTGYLEYSFSIYPAADFFPSDVAVVSIGSCVAVVLLVLLFTSAFLTQDFHNQGRLRQQQEMLTLKQKFVRFISHEIRTPMNTMSIGLMLLMDELDHMLTFLQREIAPSKFGYNDAIELPEAPSVAADGQLSSHDQAVGLPYQIEHILVPGESKRSSDPAAVSQGELALRKDLVAKLESWSQLLKEIDESSKSSVSIFNELLSYDSIQQECMSIDKEALPAWETISSSVQPFFIQARYAALLVEGWIRFIGLIHTVTGSAMWIWTCSWSRS